MHRYFNSQFRTVGGRPSRLPIPSDSWPIIHTLKDNYKIGQARVRDAEAIAFCRGAKDIWNILAKAGRSRDTRRLPASQRIRVKHQPTNDVLKLMGLAVIGELVI